MVYVYIYIYIYMVCTYIYNEILLSHKKEWNIAICNNTDGPVDYHSEVKTKTNIIWYHFYVKEESEKVGLKLDIQKTKIMASGLITSWEIDGERVETVSDFIFGGCKITADGDCSHEIKRCLLLGRKVMTT